MFAFLFGLCLVVVVVVGELTEANLAKIGSLLDKRDERLVTEIKTQFDDLKTQIGDLKTQMNAQKRGTPMGNW